MIAGGCLFLIVLPIMGLVVGLFLAGAYGAIWGAATGFVIAVLMSGVMTYALVMASRRK